MLFAISYLSILPNAAPEILTGLASKTHIPPKPPLRPFLRRFMLLQQPGVLILLDLLVSVNTVSLSIFKVLEISGTAWLWIASYPDGAILSGDIEGI